MGKIARNATRAAINESLKIALENAAHLSNGTGISIQTGQPLTDRFAEAYLNMAQTAGYRPNAPSDGMGNIEEDYNLEDTNLLKQEAVNYANDFFKEENIGDFSIGFSNYITNRELVYIIEAARLLCGGDKGIGSAARLLSMALNGVLMAGIERDGE